MSEAEEMWRAEGEPSAGDERSPLERSTPFFRNVVLLGLAFVVLWFLWSVRGVLNPLILGYLLAFIATPVVRRLKQRGLSHGAAVFVIFVGAALATCVLAAGLAYQGWHLTREVIGETESGEPGLVERLEKRVQGALEGTERRLAAWGVVSVDEAESAAGGEAAETGIAAGEVLPGEVVGVPPPEAVAGAGPGAVPESDRPRLFTPVVAHLRAWLTSQEAVDRAGEAGMRWTTSFVQFLFRSVTSLVGLGTLLFLLPVYTYFLLFQLDTIHGFVRRYLPHRDRGRILRVGSQIGEVISSFFRGRLLVCLIKGLLTAAGLVVLGVPYALLFGLLSGFLSLVPFVGPLLAFVLTFLIALTEHSIVGAAWRVGLVFSLAELIEGYVLIPKILGDSLGLDPVVVLASVMIGGAALGFFGMLVALPLTASLVILAREFVLPALAAWADGADGEGRRA